MPAVATRMTESDIERLQRELDRLMNEHIESLQRQAFVMPSDDQLREADERLKRIRDVSAEYVAVLARISALPES